ncbi:hypothetical protein SASPL_133191 [Salvia splendens]|uniref:Elongator complex protein 2 n=1 Tax=Salvia splendens TaxID=180675 RepID=A0A8X8X0V5_SALSN|nr:hypothetical protein SASPL_133191 [Salvia splendens]
MEGGLGRGRLMRSLLQWRNVLQVPEKHKKGVTCIAAIVLSQSDALFASSSSDGVVSIWEIISGSECKLSCLDSIVTGKKAMVALSLVELPGNRGHLALVMGGLDNKIHIYCVHLKTKGYAYGKMALQNTHADNTKEETSLATYIKGHIFVAGSSSYQISLESLLIGHENWVYSVEWQPPQSSSIDGIECYQPQSILSASMDKTMMIWQPEKTTVIWMNMVTVGELSHCARGFYGGHWSLSGSSILAHGYGGSFHHWKNVGTDFDDWKPQKVPSGHFGPVSDISWAREGEYLLSTSRVFSAWSNKSIIEDGEAWHEIARPQVHGHDMNCVTMIRGKGNHRFVSGADEKVGRVFEAPLSFLKTLNHTTSKKSSFADDLPSNVQILGVNMSALGLSQKPIYLYASSESKVRTNNEVVDTLETVPEAVPTVLTEPPIEEQLAWHTLWPESHKLYGHRNELFSLCSDHDGKLVASSCKDLVCKLRSSVWGHDTEVCLRNEQVPKLTGGLLLQVGSWKVVAVGMENGLVELWTLSNTRNQNGGVAEPNAAVAVRFDPFLCHVHRLNTTKSEDSTSVQLASCGADHCVRLFQVYV